MNSRWLWMVGGGAVVVMGMGWWLRRRAQAASPSGITSRTDTTVGVQGRASELHPHTFFTIVMENKDYEVLDRMPYLRELASQGALLTNYHSTLHPSLPNYLVMTSGQTFGVTDDAYHRIDGTDHLFAQMDAAQIPWVSYAEDMGDPCSTDNHGLYLARHQPAVFYDSVLSHDCETVVKDLSSLPTDLASNLLNYVWITPNRRSDMHDAPASVGDAWLREWIPRLQAAPGYQHGGAIFILFDEGERGTRIPAVVLSPRIEPGTVDTTNYPSHASYARTMQDLLGLPTLPATEHAPSFRRLFTD